MTRSTKSSYRVRVILSWLAGLGLVAAAAACGDDATSASHDWESNDMGGATFPPCEPPCGPGQACNVAGTCVAVDTCLDDVDCAEGEVCDASGACVDESGSLGAGSDEGSGGGGGEQSGGSSADPGEEELPPEGVSCLMPGETCDSANDGCCEGLSCSVPSFGTPRCQLANRDGNPVDCPAVSPGVGNRSECPMSGLECNYGSTTCYCFCSGWWCVDQ